MIISTIVNCIPQSKAFTGGCHLYLNTFLEYFFYKKEQNLEKKSLLYSIVSDLSTPRVRWFLVGVDIYDEYDKSWEIYYEMWSLFNVYNIVVT